jgi:hypothetical protein
MVTARLIGFTAVLVVCLGSDDPTPPKPADPVGSALGKGAFSWYDSATDQAKAIDPPAIRERASTAGNSSPSWGWRQALGSLMSLSLFGLALAALIALMVWFWRVHQPIDQGENVGASKGTGGISRVESLPEGMRDAIASSDPWEEAVRRRDRGDLAGAVIYLFAHQLLTLSRLGLVRLAPGRTGRQLLRSVADVEFRALAQPTLRHFEVVYYGHRNPTPDEFAALWDRAEAFERRVAGGVVA